MLFIDGNHHKCSEQLKAARADATDAFAPDMTVETALEHARRAFALKKYEQAVEYYATALELQYVIEIGLIKLWF